MGNLRTDGCVARCFGAFSLCFQVEEGDWRKLPDVPNVKSPKNYSLAFLKIF